ncbi:MAG: DUF1223 domain-containing protein [Chthonomonadales bacterium]
MKRVWKHRITCLVTTQIICLGLVAQSPLPASSLPKPQAILVELFTSEGCSSCPPADTLLREINDTRSDSGQLIIGISEHVTYWNSLGWTDPFSSPLFTERQKAYGERFALNSVYTPQMVVNGAEQIVGSDRDALARALKKELARPAQVAVHILSTRVIGGVLVVKFSLVDAIPNIKGDIVAVLADDIDQSSVLHGENSGRVLSHVAVARSLNRIAMAQPLVAQEIRLPLPQSFQTSHRHHLILFAQAPSHGLVLGVDTSPLSQFD